jgi:hypothetical protein
VKKEMACELVFGIYLPPYSYVVLTVVLSVIVEVLSIFVIAQASMFLKRFFKYFNKSQTSGSSDLVVDGEDSKSSTQWARRLYQYAQLVYASSTFVYLIFAVPKQDSAFGQYEDIMGRVANSSVLSIAVGFLIEGTVIGTENRTQPISYDLAYELETNTVLQCFVLCAKFFSNSNHIDEYIATVRKPAFDLHETATHNVISTSFPSHSTIVTQQQEESNILITNLDSYYHEKSWLEVVVGWDYVITQIM